jgi:hypothetical protein
MGKRFSKGNCQEQNNREITRVPDKYNAKMACRRKKFALSEE